MIQVISAGGKASGGGSYAISAPIMGVDFTWDGGDNTCQVIDEGSRNWQMRFLSSGNLKFLSNRLIDEFLVGGGGRGFSPSTAGAFRGGGSGYTKTVKSVVLVANTVYPIVVGAGATSATAQAGTSSAFGASAAGGFGGNTKSGAGNGGSGGAGSGPSLPNSYEGGTDGSNGGGDSSYRGLGQGTTTRAFGEADGDLYAKGGDIQYAEPSTLVGTSPNTGDGGGANYRTDDTFPGASGIVIIRNHREEATA